jgi:predicted NBD/HSP70 family sugar kinase
MARPHKHDWTNIQNAFECGIDKKEICFKYKVSINALNRRIAQNGWQMLGTINDNINAIKDGFAHLTETVMHNPKLESIVIARVTTILEDNEIIINNRKLASEFQRLIMEGIRCGEYLKPQQIKVGTSSLKDLETIANPKPDVQVNNNNTVQAGIQIYIPSNDRD